MRNLHRAAFGSVSELARIAPIAVGAILASSLTLPKARIAPTAQCKLRIR